MAAGGCIGGKVKEEPGRMAAGGCIGGKVGDHVWGARGQAAFQASCVTGVASARTDRTVRLGGRLRKNTWPPPSTMAEGEASPWKSMSVTVAPLGSFTVALPLNDALSGTGADPGRASVMVSLRGPFLIGQGGSVMLTFFLTMGTVCQEHTPTRKGVKVGGAGSILKRARRRSRSHTAGTRT